MLRLPRKKEAAPKVINCRRTSADLYEGAPSAATATQKRAGGAPSAAPATQKLGGQSISNRRTSADLYEVAPSAAPARQKRAGGAPSAAPATQNEAAPKVINWTCMKVLQVLHPPGKTSLRCSKFCACHSKRGGAQNNQSSPDFRGPL